MTNCINIYNIDHLPNEQTILIRYLITCSGTWYLSQLLTAYRGVCDTEWTVMYPNDQHPQHTDFPIVVNNPSYNATFAWNYGGIPGINSENFDSQHSYLTQLTIFNYECMFTGTGSTGQGGGSTGNGGGQTGTTGHGTIIIGNPTPPAPPFPPPSGPNTPVVIYPTPTSSVEPNAYQGPTFTGSGVQTQNPYYEPTVHVVYNPVATIPIETVGNVVHTVSSTTNPVYVETTNTNQNPNVVIVNANTSPILVNNNIPIIVGTSTSSNLPGYETNLPNLPIAINPVGVETASNGGGQPGGSTTTIVVTNPVTPQVYNVTTYDTRNLIYNAYVDIQLATSELYVGQPLVYSAVFQPPSGVELDATMTITLYDGARTYTIGTINGHTSFTEPLMYGTSVHSSILHLGDVVISVQVTNSNHQVVAIRATTATISQQPGGGGGSGGGTQTTYPDATINQITYPDTNTSQLRTTQSANSQILTVGTVAMEPTPTILDLSSNQSKFLILSRITSYTDTNLTAVFETDFTNTDSYRIRIQEYSPDNFVILPGDLAVPILPEDLPTIVRVYAESTDRITVNDGLWYPHTHTVGLKNIALIYGTVICAILPNIGYNKSKSGRLYLSKNYKLRTVSATATSTSLSANLPYINEYVGLVIHGQKNYTVSSDVTIHSAVTNFVGAASWSNISLEPNDYYSIILKTNDEFNPYRNVIYNGRYTV